MFVVLRAVGRFSATVHAMLAVLIMSSAGRSGGGSTRWSTQFPDNVESGWKLGLRCEPGLSACADAGAAPQVSPSDKIA
jgi:hypothetical protein